MATPKLFTALNTLSIDEWSSLKKFMLMNLKKDSDSIRLLLAAQKNKTKLLKDDFTNTLYEKDFNQITKKSYSNLHSNLFAIFEDWLAWQNLLSTKHDKDLHLVQAYNKKGLFSFAEKADQRIRKYIERTSTLDLDHSRIIYNLNTFQYYSNNPAKNNSAVYSIDKIITNFKKYYKEHALMILCELASYESINDLDFNQEKEKVLASLAPLEKSSLSEEITLLFKLINNKDPNAYAQLLQTLDSGKFDPASSTNLLFCSYVKRFSVVMWMEHLIDDDQLTIKAFDKYFEAIEANPSVLLTDYNFFNAVDALAYCLDYEVTDKFINKWSSSVSCTYPEGLKSFAQALNAFKNERYGLVAPLILVAKIENPILRIASGGILTIAYYMEKNDLLHTHLRNFKSVLKRNKNKLPPSVYKAQLNIISLVELLQKRRIDPSIEIDLSSYNNLFYRAFFEKILKNKK